MPEPDVRSPGDDGIAVKARPKAKKNWQEIPGSICAPIGFRAGAVFCDIKKLGTGQGSDKGRKDDLALIVSETPAVAVGLFTANTVKAAPVIVSARHLAKAKAIRGVVLNSGNANACTGAQGLRDAEKMCALMSHETDAGIAANFLVCSTGRIGVPMPMQNIARGIEACGKVIERSPGAAAAAANAILTSDTRRKEIAVEFKIGSRTARLGGICKGAGMIQPQLKALHATMLACLTTDVAISRPLLQRALVAAVAQSFNRISVDGDMSTNDTILVLANGQASHKKITTPNSAAFRGFQAALNFVTLELAKMIVRDGEGVSRFITLRVRGAKSARDAEKVARAIGNSALVKTSWHGGDPNWGRILCAIGYAGTASNEKTVSIGYSLPGHREIVQAFRRGRPTSVAFAQLTAITSQPEFDLHINLGGGAHRTTFHTCELTEDYVSFNKGDINDPTTLAG